MSITNQDKVASYETWATIPTTWATETRTWLDCSTIIDNTSRTASSLTNESIDETRPIWHEQRTPWTESTPWADTVVGITNQAKP